MLLLLLSNHACKNNSASQSPNFLPYAHSGVVPPSSLPSFLSPGFIPVPSHSLPLSSAFLPNCDRPTDVLHQHEQPASQPAPSQPHIHSLRLYIDRGREGGCRSRCSLLRQGVPLSSPPSADSHSHSGAYLSQMQLRQHSFVQWTKWEKGGEGRGGREGPRQSSALGCVTMQSRLNGNRTPYSGFLNQFSTRYILAAFKLLRVNCLLSLYLILSVL